MNDKVCKGCMVKNKYPCSSHIYDSNYDTFHNIFRDRFCPCKTCIVKITCREKDSYYSYSIKCKLFLTSKKEYLKYQKEMNLSHTIIHRRRRIKKK